MNHINQMTQKVIPLDTALYYNLLIMYIGTPNGGAPIQPLRFALETKTKFSSHEKLERKLEGKQD